MRIERVGGDKVEIGERHLLIFARHPMEGWEATEFCRSGVMIDGVLFYIFDVQEGRKPYRMRYELRLWSDNDQKPVRVVEYNERIVKDRDRAARKGSQHEHLSLLLRALLFLFYPILGQLWIFVKRPLCEFAEIDLRDATRIALLVEGTLAGVFAFIWAFTNHSLSAVLGFRVDVGPGGVYLALLLIALDVLWRSDQLLREQPCPDGFLEWLFRLLLRCLRKRGE